MDVFNEFAGLLSGQFADLSESVERYWLQLAKITVGLLAENVLLSDTVAVIAVLFQECDRIYPPLYGHVNHLTCKYITLILVRAAEKVKSDYPHLAVKKHEARIADELEVHKKS